MSRKPLRSTLSEKALSVMGVPHHLHHLLPKDFDTYKSRQLRDVKDFLLDYVKDMDYVFDNNLGLFLYGSNGVGKTFIGSMVVKEAYRWRYTAKRVSFYDYIEEYTRTWSSNSASEKEELMSNLYTEYKAVQFLCLEEIGKEVSSKVAAPILEDLLRYREDKGLPTIICTNLDISTVEERYGRSIVSLIQGNMTPILIEGEDKRNKIYTKKQEDYKNG